ncbi:hypothetical protein GTH32_03340 [Alteromonas sp. 345S023]|uniref:Uncharacterized protein n=1 Tax=Alteromonas profundi TaxID=2696062 RepID=A0A7X5RJU5_9ALTE|nr:hypothetical protein [Alteromonas profundi]NDV90227.1 hypothetical protein [Alteromonas profundi]
MKSIWRLGLLVILAVATIFCYAKGFFTGALVFMLVAIVLEVAFWQSLFSIRKKSKPARLSK